MMKHLSYCTVFAIMILFLALTSCTPESCFEETNAFLKGTFYSVSSGKSVAQAPDSLTMYGINPVLTKLYSKASKVQPAYIPLNPGNDFCSYIIKINGIVDTVKFWYSTYPHLISVECGYTFYHSIDSVSYTKNKIVEIEIKNKNVTTLKEENIRIYF